MTTTEETEAIARQLYEAFDNRDKELFMDLMADDVVELDADSDLSSGKEYWWVARQENFHEPFPDFSEEVEHVIAEDDMAAVRWRYSGTHEGSDLFSVPPTGEEITGTGNTHLRVEDGKICDVWTEWNYTPIYRALEIQPSSTAEMRIQSQLLEVLLRVLRHNISNDLNVITGMAEMLANGDVPPEDYGKRIQHQAEQLQASAMKVRDVERAIIHQERTETVNPAELIGTVLAKQRKEHPEAQIDVSLPEQDVTLASNREILSLVLEEAIGNAILHTVDSDPIIEVTLAGDESGEHAARITVTDNGPGIPDHELTPIERGREDPLEHGSGIGLWAIKWGVERLNGHVDIETPESGGTVLDLHLGELD